MEHHLRYLSWFKGAYVISLLACGRWPGPEEEKRGGAAGIVEASGQSILVHAIPDGQTIWPQTGNLA